MDKKITAKNYLFAIGIAVITILFVFYIVEWYNTTKEYYRTHSVITQVVREIKINEIENYLIDNPQTILYISSANDETIKNFEKKFKDLIDKEEITEIILYLDVSKEENTDFEKILSKFDKEKLDKIITPNIIYFESDEIISTMYEENTNITKRDVYNFLIRNGIITND